MARRPTPTTPKALPKADPRARYDAPESLRLEGWELWCASKKAEQTFSDWVTDQIKELKLADGLQGKHTINYEPTTGRFTITQTG